jgi:hypothetical protein
MASEKLLIERIEEKLENPLVANIVKGICVALIFAMIFFAVLSAVLAVIENWLWFIGFGLGAIACGALYGVAMYLEDL